MSPKKAAGGHTVLAPGPDGKYYCPECKAGPYDTAKGLSSHRRSAHKIQGMAPSTIHERNRQQQAPDAPKMHDSDADARRREERDYKREYRQRKKKESLSTLPAPVPIAQPDPEPPPIAPATAPATALHAKKENKKDVAKHGKKRGPYKSRGKTNSGHSKALAAAREIEVQAPIQGTRQEYYDHRNPPRIPESTLAIAFGRVLEFSNGLAREYDLPQRQFTEELLALVRRS